MADATLYEMLGLSKERADEIAKIVRRSFSQSKSPSDWIKELIEAFEITPETAEVFACGWFAGRYAGVSEVFSVVEREMDKMERDKAEKESKYPQSDGYA